MQKKQPKKRAGPPGIRAAEMKVIMAAKAHHLKSSNNATTSASSKIMHTHTHKLYSHILNKGTAAVCEKNKTFTGLSELADEQ
jgi:hypothetical protein